MGQKESGKGRMLAKWQGYADSSDDITFFIALFVMAGQAGLFCCKRGHVKERWLCLIVDKKSRLLDVCCKLFQ